MGSAYVNDFVNAGRVQQVIVQADAKSRMQLDDVLKLYVRGSTGQVVPLAELVTPVWGKAALQLVRFQGYPSARISGRLHPAFPAAMR
jgi:multidrug efflux pump